MRDVRLSSWLCLRTCHLIYLILGRSAAEQQETFGMEMFRGESFCFLFCPETSFNFHSLTYLICLVLIVGHLPFRPFAAEMVQMPERHLEIWVYGRGSCRSQIYCNTWYLPTHVAFYCTAYNTRHPLSLEPLHEWGRTDDGTDKWTKLGMHNISTIIL